MQHDTDEFQIKLREFLEIGEEGKKMRQIYSKLFDFTLESRFVCRHVAYSSSKAATLSNLNLNVMGFASLEDSLKDYMSPEKFDAQGGNQYDAEEHGKQDADRKQIFRSLPSALQVVFNRASYDVQKQAVTKVNQRFTFPDLLDLESCLPAERFELEASQKCTKYRLFAILVHSGQFQSGHYWAYIAPNPAEQRWYSFNDNTVDPVSKKAAMEIAFGG